MKVGIIGAGIIGLCTAFELQRRGYEVLVIERDREPGDGCSMGNGGLVVPSHFEPLATPGMVRTGLRLMVRPGSPFGISGMFRPEIVGFLAGFLRAATPFRVEKTAQLLRNLNLQSRELFETTYQAFATEAGYARRGELMVCGTESSFKAEAQLADHANALGLETRVLDGKQLGEFEPDFPYRAAGAVYFADDAHLTPPLFMRALRQDLVAKGTVFAEGETVHEFHREGQCVRAAGGYEADQWVIAAGVGSPALLRKLGIRLPLLAGTGFGLTLPTAPRPQHPAILIEPRVAITPMSDGLRLVGTMQLCSSNRPTNSPLRLANMRNSVAQFCPRLNVPELQTQPAWHGYRPCLPDGIPAIGRLAGLSNVILATGHAMMGFSLGPITGKLVADLVEDPAQTCPDPLLDPNRFA